MHPLGRSAHLRALALPQQLRSAQSIARFDPPASTMARAL